MIETGHIIKILRDEIINATFCLHKPGKENINELHVIRMEDLLGISPLLFLGNLDRYFH